MDRHEKKEARRKWQRQQEREAALRAPRHYRELLSMGLGPREFSIVQHPSFEVLEVWDVRRDPHSNALKLYVSRGPDNDAERVVGCASVDVPSTELDALASRLRALRIPVVYEDVSASTEHYAVLDGTQLELLIEGSMSQAILCWSKDHAPAPWREVEQLVVGALARFRAGAAEPIPATD